MNVLPQACARLLLLSLLCTTSVCQWSKSEWSRGSTVCHLPLGTVCTCPASRNTSFHVESTCCGLFLFSISPVLGILPCHPTAVLQPVSTKQAKPPFFHGISLSPTAPFALPIPDALIFPGRQPLCAVPGKELHRVHPGGQGLLLLHRRGETLQGSLGLLSPPC